MNNFSCSLHMRRKIKIGDNTQFAYHGQFLERKKLRYKNLTSSKFFKPGDRIKIDQLKCQTDTQMQTENKIKTVSAMNETKAEKCSLR